MRKKNIYIYILYTVPSRELTYPTLRSSENHRLKMPFLGGYASSLEGIYYNFITYLQHMQPYLAGGFNIGFCSKHGSKREHLQPPTKNQAQQHRSSLKSPSLSPAQDNPWVSPTAALALAALTKRSSMGYLGYSMASASNTVRFGANYHTGNCQTWSFLRGFWGRFVWQSQHFRVTTWLVGRDETCPGWCLLWLVFVDCR